MINLIRGLFNKGEKMSVVKRFINNPDRFILRMEVINDEIIISIKDKSKDSGE